MAYLFLDTHADFNIIVVFGLGDGPQGDTLDESNYFNDDSPFNVNFTLVGQDIGVNGTQTNNSQIWMVVAYTSDPTGNCAGTRTQFVLSALRSKYFRVAKKLSSHPHFSFGVLRPEESALTSTFRTEGPAPSDQLH